MGQTQHPDQFRLPDGDPDADGGAGLGRPGQGRSHEGEDSRRPLRTPGRGGGPDPLPRLVRLRSGQRPGHSDRRRLHRGLIMAARIRVYRPDDLETIYEICLLIGDNGNDATPLFRERRILGDLYAGAYGRFSPELAFVAEDEQDVCGFTLGVLDTAGFEARLEREWWPALRQRYR